MNDVGGMRDKSRIGEETKRNWKTRIDRQNSDRHEVVELLCVTGGFVTENIPIILWIYFCNVNILALEIELQVSIANQTDIEDAADKIKAVT